MTGDTKTFRVKIISPLKATETDLARRQQRYSQAANPNSRILVENLEGGPKALNSSGDVLNSAAAIFQQGRNTTQQQVDGILIDCVFDPAVAELREATGLPTFGPTELVEKYGYGSNLCSLQALGISYEEAKQPEIYNRAMLARLKEAVVNDGAQAIMFGSTTMSLTPEMRETAQGKPLFMPGMVALKVMEQLWFGDLWPG
jgi:Asp/Glu/hydantoin racemase